MKKIPIFILSFLLILSTVKADFYDNFERSTLNGPDLFGKTWNYSVYRGTATLKYSSITNSTVLNEYASGLVASCWYGYPIIRPCACSGTQYVDVTHPIEPFINYWNLSFDLIHVSGEKSYLYLTGPNGTVGIGYFNGYLKIYLNGNEYWNTGFSLNTGTFYNIRSLYKNGILTTYVNDVLVDSISTIVFQAMNFTHVGIYTSQYVSDSGNCYAMVETNFDELIIENEESMITLFLFTVPNVKANNNLSIFLSVYYNFTPLSNLTQNNFQLFLNESQLQINNFTNLENGSYQIETTAISNIGENTLKVELNYENKTFQNSTKIFVLPEFNDKILFITDNNWKNVLSLSPIKKPILITSEIDEKIINYINSYNPGKIYLLGDIEGNIIGYETYNINSYNDIPKLFFSEKGIYVGSDREKVTLATLLASLLNKPLVFEESYASEEFNLINNTIEEIEEFYFQKVKENNRNINYLVLSNENSLLAPVIASQKIGFIISTNSSDTNEIVNLINSAVTRLNNKGLFINNIDYYLNGAYLLILDYIPQIVKEDPVEASWGLNDPKDGTTFTTDLEYGDLNNDTYLDIAVGRLPSNEQLASIMFARTFLEDEKKALVASEYLHTAWPVILLYGGGGMLEGRTVAKILEDQNYDVTRLVEHRSDPMSFLESLTPENAEEFLKQAKKIGREIGIILGKSLGTIVSKILIVLKVLQYAEQCLEMYLEYDWSTFGPKYENALEYLHGLNLSQNLTQEDALKLIYTLWPYEWEDIANETLIEQMPKNEIIYYEGLGDGNFWILPNEIPDDKGVLDWKEFLMNRYNGSEKLLPENIPNLNSRIVWDNSDLAVKGEMFNKFLEKGTASFIGASALNYAPFSAEIDSRFFRQSSTIGTALINSVNDFRDDWLTWDPLNILKPGIKAKALREFVLFGDPSLTKDPIIEGQNYTKSIECNSFCELNITIPVLYTIEQSENGTTIKVEAEDYLLEAFEPIIPLKEFEYYLPFEARITSFSITSSSKTYENITLDKVDLLSHSSSSLTSGNISYELYPQELYRLSINTTIDNRTRIKLVHATLQYNESNKTAIVHENISLSLQYETPVEFLISTSDTIEGQDEIIKIKIWSNLSSNATIYLKISNQTFSEIIKQNVTILKGENNFDISYLPLTVGSYLVEGFLLTEDVILGPRQDIFDVFLYQTPNFTSSFSPHENEESSQEFIVGTIIKSEINNNTINMTQENFTHIFENTSITFSSNGIPEMNNMKNCDGNCSDIKEEKPKLPTAFIFLMESKEIVVATTIFIIVLAYLISKFNLLKWLRI